LIRKEFEFSHARITPGGKEDSASSNASSSATTASKKKSAIAAMTTATRKRSTLKKKADCKAHMAVGLHEGRWRVVVFQVEHTHPMVKIKGRVK